MKINEEKKQQFKKKMLKKSKCSDVINKNY